MTEEEKGHVESPSPLAGLKRTATESLQDVFLTLSVFSFIETHLTHEIGH